MLDQRTPILKLPNELLAYVAEYVGPPDLSRAKPGWLVFPAVCTLWRDIARKIPAWKSGSIEDTQRMYDWTYARVDILPEHELATPDISVAWGHPDTPFRSATAINDFAATSWGIRPVWKGGAVEYVDGYLAVLTQSGDDTTRRDVNDFLSPPLPSEALDFSWVGSITIDCRRCDAIINEPPFTFADVPCIVAPALHSLHLTDYVVDWRCNGLKSLRILMLYLDNGENPTQYCYSPSHLLERMEESRLSLETVFLSNCFPSINNDDNAPVPPVVTIYFPHIHEIFIDSDAPVSWWLRQRMILRPGIQFVFAGPWANMIIGFMRSLGCEFASSRIEEEHRSDSHGSHGVIEALSFHRHIATAMWPFDDSIRCSVKGYARGVYRGTNAIDAVKHQAHDIRGRHYLADLGLIAAGTSQPAFVVNASWDAESWTSPDDYPHFPHCTSLDGVRDILIDGDEGLFASGNGSSNTWTTVLKHFPKLRRLHITSPSVRSLALLLTEGLVPELETLWLRGSHDGVPDVEVEWLLSILRYRRRLKGVEGHTLFGIRLENVGVIGDAKNVKLFRKLCGM